MDAKRSLMHSVDLGVGRRMLSWSAGGTKGYSHSGQQFGNIGLKPKSDPFDPAVAPPEILTVKAIAGQPHRNVLQGCSSKYCL